MNDDPELRVGRSAINATMVIQKRARLSYTVE